jgi:undecaprenyl-diphosphatase
MRPGRSPLRLGHAVALGLVQGPTELLPVSSSGHTSLVPLLAGWPYAELDPELRKAFEVALHAGAGLALAIDMHAELTAAAETLDRRRAEVIALSIAPPAAAGYVFEQFIERRLSEPRSIALGMIAGAVAMALADASAAHRGRRREDARACDGLALGLAQAAALLPGVSRNGATLTVARVRGFGRCDAEALSWHAALPVILGATALKGARFLRGGRPGTPRGVRACLGAAAASAFASTLLCARALHRGRYPGRSLLPYSVYRCLLAAIVLRRLQGAHNTDR